MESIRAEVRRNANLSTNIDSLRSRYVDIDEDSNITVFFPALEVWAYEQKLFEILADSQRIDYNTRWNRKPDYVSYELYGTVVYWKLLLYVNQIDSIEDFVDLDYLFIPSFGKILELVEAKPDESEILNLTEEPPAAPNYYKLYPQNDDAIAKRKAKDALEEYEPGIIEWVEGEVTDSTDSYPFNG